MKKSLIYFLIIISSFLYSQNDSVLINDLGFVNHLINLQEFDAAIHLLNNYKTESFLLKDSCNYLLGWCYYNSKEMDSSAYYFSKVSSNSATYNKSTFFSSFCNTTFQNYDNAKVLLNKISSKENNLNKLKNIQLGGIFLLERDLNKFDSLSNLFTYNYYPIVETEKNLISHAQEIREFKPRSMFVAGALSSIIPGMGKIYIGKYGEGAAAFLMVSILGIVSYENYKKDGIFDAKTLLFGTMFASYYIGNIWGSTIGVKIKRDEFYNEIEYKILFDIHIPLRTVFN